jgi:hippurate hydrolase
LRKTSDGTESGGPTLDSNEPTEYINRWHDEFTAIRRDLHAHPELGFEEHRTARVVQERLAALGIEHHIGIGKTGIVAVICTRTSSGRSRPARRHGCAADAGGNAFAHKSRYDGRHGCA